MLVHVLIKGKVQGVFFRAFTKRNADNLGVKGWVKNLETGDVEAELQGSEEAVNELIKKLRQGPLGARVDNLKAVENKKQEDYENFEIRS